MMAAEGQDIVRAFALRLYRAVLRSHKSLPPQMRALGDEYVRSEFRLHRTADAQHLEPFFKQWTIYVDTLNRSKPGTFLNSTRFDQAEFTKEQMEKMHELRSTLQAMYEQEAQS